MHEMKSLFTISSIVAALFVLALHLGHAQPADVTPEIEKTLRAYLSAMSSRDVDALRSLLDTHLAVIEAGQTNAKIAFPDTSSTRTLLPPEGNHDWDHHQLRLSSVKAELSPTHPSVAMVSFTLTHPLTPKRVAELEEALQRMPGEFDAQQTKTVQSMITHRAIHHAMFALLARHNGQWKIVCMTFPK